MARNVISVRGGEVHLPSLLDEIDGFTIPFCLDSSKVKATRLFVATDKPATCKACKRRLKGIPEPARIPENWLWMAKNAHTATARAWWRKKCGIEEAMPE